jgi:uncharacterized protein (TIGR03790 family)
LPWRASLVRPWAIVCAVLVAGIVTLCTYVIDSRSDQQLIGATGKMLRQIARAAPANARPVAGNDSPAAATVVLYNESDRDSRELARFYAAKRGIPNELLVGVDCPAREEISREEYDRTIAEPLRKTFARNGWWKVNEDASASERVERNRIRFIAVMRGVPLRITSVLNYAGDTPNPANPVGGRNEAAVDSELVTLGLALRNISGAMNNPYYRSFTRFADAKMPGLMLVGRLDAASPATVRRMITDGLAVEQNGLRGFAYIDARGIKDPGLAEGDKWLFNIAAEARRQGTPVILDDGEGMFPVPYPMLHAALYFGWYSENVAGPMADPRFRFEPGAIAVHIHSFSAATLREPRRYWAAPLLEEGAAATLGNVYEPYLGLTPNLDVFYERLRAGMTFAESAWSAERVLSWMTTCIGDPLYRPFKSGAELQARGKASEWDAYAAAAKTWADDSEAARKRLSQQGAKMRSGVIMEGLGLLELTINQPARALEAFAQARQFYKNPGDILRVAIHETLRLRALKRTSEAVAFVDKELKLYGNEPAAEVLRMLRRDLVPPAPAGAAPAPR